MWLVENVKQSATVLVSCVISFLGLIYFFSVIDSTVSLANLTVLCGTMSVVGASSFVLTAVVRNFALKKNLLDLPNDRSSHTLPTPRGGGIAIILTVLAGLVGIGLNLQESVADGRLLGFCLAASFVALIGLLDDFKHVAVRWRLLVHFGAAGLVLSFGEGFPLLKVGSFWFDFGIMGYILAAFYLVWMLNLFNFMDGIDGIASVEALTVGLGILVVFFVRFDLTSTSELYWLSWGPALVAAATFGFMLWNFPTAKIFMGDACSGFLGFFLGCWSLFVGWQSPALYWCWLILLGVFVVDATVTLLRRFARGERVSEAHRTHAYQVASRYYGSHKIVTLAVCCINILVLLPVAVLVALDTVDGALATFMTYSLLVLLALKFRAGKAEDEAA